MMRNVPYINKLWFFIPSKIDTVHITTFKYFCASAAKRQCTEITVNLSDDVQFYNCYTHTSQSTSAS